jgi:hypothetical protein
MRNAECYTFKKTVTLQRSLANRSIQWLILMEWEEGGGGRPPLPSLPSGKKYVYMEINFELLSCWENRSSLS